MKERALGVLLAMVGLGLVVFLAIPPDRADLTQTCPSTRLLDRHGVLLREVLSRDYTTSEWIHLEEIAPQMIQATLIREDKRFLMHHGVDPLAIGRAFVRNLSGRRITSGGSTITMQVAKIVLRSRGRSIFNKVLEAIYALKLELHLSKAMILEIYLNRVPYSNQTYGIEAACQYYFRKHATDLSWSESALLSVIPKNPSTYNPYWAQAELESLRVQQLRRIRASGAIDEASFGCALNERTTLAPRNADFKAPHFTDHLLLKVLPAYPHPPSQITSTIDINLQENIEKTVSTIVRSLRPHNVTQAAVLVMDASSGEVLAMIGSADYFGARDGQNNGCTALRQPGSSIKPFLYGLAFSTGMPASYILPDSVLEFPLRDGTTFAPRNFGDVYHGPGPARQALGSSFNVPTVYLLDRVGVQRFYDLLRSLGFEHLSERSDYYGLALGLGAAEVTLLELANAYRMVCRGGEYSREVVVLHPRPEREKPRPVFDRPTAYLLTDILSDNGNRLVAFGDDSPLNLPFPCAVKTGTTKNYRDNWCVGFTSRYVVAVWVGNFDNSAMCGVSGVSGAAPLFRAIMLDLHRDAYPPAFARPPALTQLPICAYTGKIAGPYCTCVIEELFLPGTVPPDSCRACPGRPPSNIQSDERVSTARTLKILSPAQGAIYEIDPQVSLETQQLQFHCYCSHTVKAMRFELDRSVIAEGGADLTFSWKPMPGAHRFKVIAETDEGTLVDSADFRVY